MKPIHHLFLSFAGFAALGLSSCAHQISYPLTDADKWTRSHISGSVRVDAFKDKAPRDEKINVRIGDDIWRTNGREGYPGGEVGTGVGKAVARHVEHSGLFEKVYYPGQGNSADYVLKGEVHDYNATGRVNRKAENTIIIGAAAASIAGAAVGAAATAEAKTDVSHSVELRNVRLQKASGGTVWAHGRYSRRAEERDVHFLQADPPALFKRVDDQLKDITSDMIQGMGGSYVAKRGNAQPKSRSKKKSDD